MHCLAPSYSDQLGNSRAALGALDNGMDVDPAGRVPNWIATKKWFTTATRTAAGQNAGRHPRSPQRDANHRRLGGPSHDATPAIRVVCGLDLINEPTGGSWETTKALSAANLETSLPEFYERAGERAEGHGGPLGWNGPGMGDGVCCRRVNNGKCNRGSPSGMTTKGKGKGNGKGKGKGKGNGNGKCKCKGNGKGKGNGKCNRRSPSGMTTRGPTKAGAGENS